MKEVKEKKKILLVDDDEVFLDLGKLILESEYEVIPVKSGKEALKLLLQGLVPNLILLDILMPNMDGWETFNRLKTIVFLQKVPIAFVTSLSTEEDEKQAYELGAADFIRKPYIKGDLLDRVEVLVK
jgi:CheY-like chemotaxis protein